MLLWSEHNYYSSKVPKTLILTIHTWLYTSYSTLEMYRNIPQISRYQVYGVEVVATLVVKWSKQFDRGHCCMDWKVICFPWVLHRRSPISCIIYPITFSSCKNITVLMVGRKPIFTHSRNTNATKPLAKHHPSVYVPKYLIKLCQKKLFCIVTSHCGIA